LLKIRGGEIKMVYFKPKERGRTLISIDLATHEILQRLRKRHYLSFAEIVRVLAFEGEEKFENMLKDYENKHQQESV